MYTRIAYTHELWFFFATGLLLRSIWTLPRYLKPKVGAYSHDAMLADCCGCVSRAGLRIWLALYALNNAMAPIATVLSCGVTFCKCMWSTHKLSGIDHHTQESATWSLGLSATLMHVSLFSKVQVQTHKLERSLNGNTFIGNDNLAN